MAIRSAVRRAVFVLRCHLEVRPGLDAFAKRALNKFPILEKRLRRMVRNERLGQTRQPQPQPWPLGEKISVAELSPRAHQVYLDIVETLAKERNRT